MLKWIRPEYNRLSVRSRAWRNGIPPIRILELKKYNHVTGLGLFDRIRNYVSVEVKLLKSPQMPLPEKINIIKRHSLDGGEKMVEQQEASGGSLLVLGIIFLIIFLLFPVFAIWLLWIAIVVMIIVGIVSLIMR